MNMKMFRISGRRIGRCCEFLEDVSEDVHFVWKNLADVKISKKNYLILISLINISQEFPIKVYVFRYVFQEITASSDLTLRKQIETSAAAAGNTIWISC